MIEITRECDDCPDLQHVLKDIDCTLLDLSKNFHASIIYGVETFFDQVLYTRLLHWKRIITGRLYNCNYPCSLYTPNELLTIPRLLSYKTDCSRCPECEEIITTTTTTQFPPPISNCVTVMVLPFAGIDTDYPYSYIDCEGALQTGLMGADDILNVCMIEHSLSIDPRFIVSQYADDCNVIDFGCICALLTNTEESEGVVPYIYSYEDCNGGVFTDISIPFGTFVYLCHSPMSLVTNFRHTIEYFSPCSDECSFSTTTTSP